MKNIIIVEKSTHPHKLESDKKIVVNKIDDNTLDIELNGETIVTHGEHGTLKVESERVIKYNQQELNPVTRSMQRVFD